MRLLGKDAQGWLWWLIPQQDQAGPPLPTSRAQAAVDQRHHRNNRQSPAATGALPRTRRGQERDHWTEGTHPCLPSRPAAAAVAAPREGACPSCGGAAASSAPGLPRPLR